MLAWAEGAWLEDVALASLGGVIALALSLRFRTPEHRWLAWLPAILATVAGVFALSEVGRATAGSGEGVFELFPELADG
jgi:alkylation response protein AidB-like acyl-CoA dehydrogenase